jgi:hypothetical protein
MTIGTTIDIRSLLRSQGNSDNGNPPVLKSIGMGKDGTGKIFKNLAKPSINSDYRKRAEMTTRLVQAAVASSTKGADKRTTRHAGFEVSQRKRKRVEQSFGWMKVVGMLRKVKLRGIDKVGWLFTFTGAAYNLCRMRNLMAGT